MARCTIFVATAIIASASFVATAHAAPKIGASAYSLSSDADPSADDNGSKIFSWLAHRLAAVSDFHFQLGVKDKSAPSGARHPSTVEQCEEREQANAATAEPETTTKNSPTGPEPLYLAF